MVLPAALKKRACEPSRKITLDATKYLISAAGGGISSRSMFKNPKNGRPRFFERLFPGRANEDSARLLYERIIAQTRQEVFYRDCLIPDSVDGRFELLVLHVFLVLNRLKKERDRTADLAQTLFDIMIYDLDQSLRVSGVGDLKVGPKLRQMAEAFYGRVSAYDAGLEGDDSILMAALERNLFGTSAPPQAAILAALSVYVRQEAAQLAGQETGALLAGEVSFQGLPKPESVID